MNLPGKYINGLRCGYTTGSCAAAAAKAATQMLLTGQPVEEVSLITPAGISLKLTVLDGKINEDSARCCIEKDSGDDPDSTNGIHIYATVSYTHSGDIVLEGGKGIGRVTRKGLACEVGTPAINPVPRQMIVETVREVCVLHGYTGGLTVCIEAPAGEEIAQKTYNPRLGIVGGISILGTTGIVEPMSEQALIDTIALELRMLRAAGKSDVVLTPGSYGENFILTSTPVDPAAVVKCSNFIGDALDFIVAEGFSSVLLIGHLGKLIKVANGSFQTHSSIGDGRMQTMAAHAAACKAKKVLREQILACITTDEAVCLLKENNLFEPVMQSIAQALKEQLESRVQGKLPVGAIIFSNQHGLLAKTSNADELVEKVRRK